MIDLVKCATVAAFFLGCAIPHERKSTDPPRSQVAAPDPDPLLTPVDEKADPCADFANYACRSDHTRPGRLQRTAEAMGNRQAALQTFLEELGQSRHDDGTRSTAIVREFYTRCQDTKARELGIGEVRRELDMVSQVGTLADLARTLGRLGASGPPIPIHLSSYWEALDSNGLR